MNTQYRKNLKAVLEASKTYCDESINTLKWELGTYDLSVDSDTTSAYQKVVPVNSIEAKINTLGGMSYKSENLIPLTDIAETTTNGITYSVSNGVITSNGTASADTSIYLVNFYINEGTYYYVLNNNVNESTSTLYMDLTNNTNMGMSIQNGQINTSISITSSASQYVFYLILKIKSGTTLTNAVYKPMLVSGSTAPTTFEPYYSGIRDIAPTSVKSLGSNLFNSNPSSLSSINVDSWTLNDGKLTLDYQSTTIDPYWYANFNNLEIGKTYTANIEILNGQLEYWAIDSSGTIEGIYHYTFIPTSSEFRLGFEPLQGTTHLEVRIWINSGSTAQAYKPYTGFTASLLIPAQVQALDGYGWGINSTCYNYIDFNAKKFIKKVGKVDLGSLDWAYASGETYPRFAVVVSGFKMPTSDTALPNVLCAKYDGVGATYLVNLGTNGIALYSNQIFIRDTNYTDATAFKTAMSGVYLYYELATPVETDISAYLTTNKITVEGGGTLTAENTYGASVPSDIDYLKEVAK